MTKTYARLIVILAIAFSFHPGTAKPRLLVPDNDTTAHSQDTTTNPQGTTVHMSPTIVLHMFMRTGCLGSAYGRAPAKPAYHRASLVTTSPTLLSQLFTPIPRSHALTILLFFRFTRIVTTTSLSTISPATLSGIFIGSATRKMPTMRAFPTLNRS